MRSCKLIKVVDTHTEGENCRVVVSGVAVPPGDTMLARMLYMKHEADWLRKMVLREPRGQIVQSANLVTPPIDPAADAGVVIMESMGYPAMSGTNAMSVGVVLLELGMVEMTEPESVVTLDTPGGLVTVTARCRGGKCLDSRLRNVPAFVPHSDVPLEVAGFGTVTADVAYAGCLYALADGRDLGFALSPDEAPDLAKAGNLLARAAAEQLPITHPDDPALAADYFGFIRGPVESDDGHTKRAKGICIVQPGWLGRSTSGTGTSACLAVMHAKGELAPGQRLCHVSLLGTELIGEILGLAKVGPYDAIVPGITGRTWIVGVSELWLDPDDPFPEGYALGDTWPGAGPEATGTI